MSPAPHARWPTRRPRAALAARDALARMTSKAADRMGAPRSSQRACALTRRTDRGHTLALGRQMRQNRTNDLLLRLRGESPPGVANPNASTVRAGSTVDDLVRAEAGRPRWATDRTPTTGRNGISARQNRQRGTRATNETHRQPAERRRALPAHVETVSQPPGRRHGPPARAAIPREAVEQGMDETIRTVSTPGRATVGRASTGRVGRAHANVWIWCRSVSGSILRALVWGEG